MRNKRFYLLLFILLFCFSINGVKAVDQRKKTDTGTGTNYSYGIKCFYYGELKSNSSYNPTAGGSIGSENTTVTPFVYGIDFRCSGKKCNSFGAKGHGKAAHTNAGNYTIVTPNNYNALFMKGTDDNKNNRKIVYSHFGAKTGEGVSKCPSKLYYDEDKALIISASGLMNTSEPGSGIGDIWYASTRGNFHYPQSFSLLSSERYKKDNQGDLKQDVEDLVKDFKEITTDASGNKYDTTDGAVGEKIKGTANRDMVEKIHNYNWKKSNYKYEKTANCKKIIGDENIKLIHKYSLYICIIAVILVVILGSFDFIKAIASSDDDALAAAGKRIKFRLISVVILLLLPVFINFTLSFVDDNFHLEVIDQEGNVVKGKNISVKIGKASDCGL